MFFIAYLFLIISFNNASCLASLHYRAAKTSSVHQLEGVALEMYRIGHYRSSISVYKKILKLSSTQSGKFQKNADWALYEIGFCYFKLRRKKLALRYFQKVFNESSLAEAVILSEQRIKEIQSKVTSHSNPLFPVPLTSLSTKETQ